MREQIKEFVNRLLPRDWDSWTLERRREFWQNKNMVGEYERTKVCALEIWQELFNGDASALTLGQARRINNYLKKIPYLKMYSSLDCGLIYGRQRGFTRDVVSLQADRILKN